MTKAAQVSSDVVARECDVLIIGAGMAGSCLARQLKLRIPELDIVVVDRKTTFDYWVGESTVEVWEDYMIRILDLGRYLERHQLQKHGLRFFFDSPEKDLPVARMSEFGRSRYHRLTARQIDRARFDTDLCVMNREIGIDVRLGVEVLKTDVDGDDAIKLDRENGHIVHTSDGPIRCRWLVDAGGKKAPLGRQLNLVEPEETARKGSYWARYRNVNNIDRLGPSDWRARVNHTQRYYSTCHFMYRGYWIWHISITDDIVSIGVEYDERQANLKFRNGELFDAWLREHACINEILGAEAEQLDFYGLKRISHCAREIFSADRWALTGMAAVFANVLGSSTSRLYATNNKLIEQMIRTDMAGDRALLEKQAGHFNNIVRAGYESGVRFLQNMDRNGSYDAWCPFIGGSLSLYFNAILPAATNDLKEEIEAAANFNPIHVNSNENVNLRMKIAALSDEFTAFLDSRGAYYASNEGQFRSMSDWEERPEIEDKVYEPRDRAREAEIAHTVFRKVCHEYLARMAELDGVAFSEEAFDRIFIADWNAGQSLGEMLDRLRQAPASAEAAPSDGAEASPASWFHRRATDYVATQMLFHVNQVGVLDYLRRNGPCGVQELAERLGLSADILDPILDYLYGVDDLLNRDGQNRYSLSDYGHRIIDRFATTDRDGISHINMFDVRVGGYGPVWANLTAMLKGESVYGKDIVRDGRFAEAGVLKISGKFWPALERVVEDLGVENALEIGLTTDLLSRLHAKWPTMRLFGLDRNDAAVSAAAERFASVRSGGGTDPEWIVGDLFEPETWRDRIDVSSHSGRGLIFSLHFHEFMAKGYDAVAGLLRGLREDFPGWYLVALEQPILPETNRAQYSDVEWLYAQSNVLIHHLIGNGRILTTEEWHRLAGDAGCRVVSDRPCDYLGYRAYLFELRSDDSREIMTGRQMHDATVHPGWSVTSNGERDHGHGTRVRDAEVIVSESVEAEPLQMLLEEMHAEFCAHSWKKVPVDITPQHLLDWENARRPTTILYYFQRTPENGRPVLVAVATIADAIRRDVSIDGFPVLARCYVRPSFRGMGLYRRILLHRLPSLIRRCGAGLKAIHMGTVDPRVDRTITDRSLPWNGFVRIGGEDLSIGTETVRVGGYLLFSPDYAGALRRASSELAATADGNAAPAIFESLLSGRWSGPGDAYSRIVEILSVNPSANETASASPIRELVEFCAHIPLVYTPCAEGEPSITA
jgi:flavin-dependent dehydrogenase